MGRGKEYLRGEDRAERPDLLVQLMYAIPFKITIPPNYDEATIFRLFRRLLSPLAVSLSQRPAITFFRSNTDTLHSVAQLMDRGIITTAYPSNFFLHLYSRQLFLTNDYSNALRSTWESEDRPTNTLGFPYATETALHGPGSWFEPNLSLQRLERLSRLEQEGKLEELEKERGKIPPGLCQCYYHALAYVGHDIVHTDRQPCSLFCLIPAPRQEHYPRASAYLGTLLSEAPRALDNLECALYWGQPTHGDDVH